MVEKLKLMGDGNIGLFILDGELGERDRVDGSSDLNHR